MPWTSCTSIERPKPFSSRWCRKSARGAHPPVSGVRTSVSALCAVSVIGRDLCKYPALMGVRQAQVVLEDGRDHSRNGGLIVGVVCCIEFWIAVTTAVLDL